MGGQPAELHRVHRDATDRSEARRRGRGRERCREEFLRKGRASIQANPVKASALLITAYDLLGRVLLKARNLVTAELGSPPPAA